MLTWKEKQDNRTGKFDIVLQKQENSNYITLLTPFDWFQETCRTCETFSTFPVTGLNMAWHWGIWKCPVRLQSIFFSMVLKSSQLWQLGLVFMCAGIGMSLKCFLLWLFCLSFPYSIPQTRHLFLSFSWVGSKTESWDLHLASCLMQNSMDRLCTSSINSDLPGTNAARWFWARAMVLLCN